MWCYNARSHTRTDILHAQAVNGGQATWFGIPVPFDMPTLIGVVSLPFSVVADRPPVVLEQS